MLKTLFDTFSYYFGENEKHNDHTPKKEIRPKLKVGALYMKNDFSKKRLIENDQKQDFNANLKFSLGVPEKSPNQNLRKRAVRNYIEN